MSPGDERSRPAGNGPANESLTDDTARVPAACQFIAQLAQCSGPDDPLFKAASRLADAWGPALNRSYRLGYENGYVAGFYEAECDMAQAWSNAAKPIRETLELPTHEELAARRGEAG